MATKWYNSNRTRGHRNLSVSPTHLRPGPKLLKFLRSHPTLAAAAKILGLNTSTLKRFVIEGGGISGDTVATILDKTGLSYDQAFVHRK